MENDLISRSELQRQFDEKCIHDCEFCPFYLRWISEDLEENGCCVLIQRAPAIDAVPVVRCKDCINYKKRHVLTADGEEKSYEEMPPEAFGGLDDMYVTMEYGINVGGKCMLDEGRGYPVDKSVFRSPNDYCSYGVRMDGDPHDSPGQ